MLLFWKIKTSSVFLQRFAGGKNQKVALPSVTGEKKKKGKPNSPMDMVRHRRIFMLSLEMSRIKLLCLSCYMLQGAADFIRHLTSFPC